MIANPDRARLTFILKLIADPHRRSRPLTLVQMMADEDELDLAAFGSR